MAPLKKQPPGCNVIVLVGTFSSAADRVSKELPVVLVWTGSQGWGLVPSLLAPLLSVAIRLTIDVSHSGIAICDQVTELSALCRENGTWSSCVCMCIVPAMLHVHHAEPGSFH